MMRFVLVVCSLIAFHFYAADEYPELSSFALKVLAFFLIVSVFYLVVFLAANVRGQR